MTRKTTSAAAWKIKERAAIYIRICNYDSLVWSRNTILSLCFVARPLASAGILVSIETGRLCRLTVFVFYYAKVYLTLCVGLGLDGKHEATINSLLQSNVDH